MNGFTAQSPYSEDCPLNAKPIALCGLTGRLWDTITVEDGNPLGSYRDHKDRNGGVCRYFYMRSGRRLRPAARTSEC